MKINELSEGQQIPIANQLLNLVTKMFGFKPTIQPKLRRTNQYFDYRNGEHVIVFEYRVRGQNQGPIPTQNYHSKVQTKDEKNKKSDD